MHYLGIHFWRFIGRDFATNDVKVPAVHVQCNKKIKKLSILIYLLHCVDTRQVHILYMLSTVSEGRHVHTIEN